MEELTPDKNELLDLITARMPFGKYQGRYISDLPEAYLVWFSKQGFPPGKLGKQLQMLYEINANGIGHILDGLRKYRNNHR
jgi:uncharacterized protein (DUF3820 family)